MIGLNCCYYYETPLGTIGIAESDGKITHLLFGSRLFDENEYKKMETKVLKEAAKQLQEYFSGKRKEFTLPLAPAGTDFMVRVWNVLRKIPYGETRSYQEVAVMAGSPKACRAVGMANNRNPISILIPCHRVIGANGDLIGYGGGLDKKAYLLELEKI